MARIIIQNDSSLPDHKATSLVAAVIAGGRVSGSGTTYCYLTIFPPHKAKVAAMRTRTGSDKFVIQDLAKGEV